MDLLIPFGLDATTKETVEPEDAKRGRACGCVCPGCEMPLMCRHPSDPDSPSSKRIHFAHDTRHPDAQKSVHEHCPFNGLIAVRMMAYTVASSLVGETIQLPSLHKLVDFDCCHQTRSVNITETSELTIEESRPKVALDGMEFDLALTFKGRQVLIRLAHDGRQPLVITPQLKSILQASKTGVLEMDVESFDRGSFIANKRQRFSEAVKAFLLADGDRYWQHHPRTFAKMAAFKDGHRCPPKRRTFGQSGWQPRKQPRPTTSERPVVKKESLEPITHEHRGYICRLCGAKWVQHSAHEIACPNGHNHLYCTVIV